ncbi:hypothetical protein I545_1487 [Mycobacterium kansasii 662]|uniref:Uncharacterized protein n=2 Tax=Mycobacterium kansasii TaxID=1768 RepID=A0A1V3WGH5_MYCKA|nr:hypothetical protein I547_5095 [Mycobacterium kansasii 824]EUA21294.1 hypothetical protein I545_1487 [Mycobacterium kansasii 662]OOK66084.1 hypothetical protein BZL29_7476 [Mycobacterium kansasii]
MPLGASTDPATPATPASTWQRAGSERGIEQAALGAELRH